MFSNTETALPAEIALLHFMTLESSFNGFSGFLTVFAKKF